MKTKIERSTNERKWMVLAILAAGVFFLSFTSAIATDDMAAVQGIVDRARVTLKEFVQDSNYTWLHNNLDHAKGVLVFPQLIKGGFIFGGSGGTGVFLVRDEKTGEW
ncbi:MAG: hypothetical protein EHM36_04150, partial [Deltaproteobacteria bacterium]